MRTQISSNTLIGNNLNNRNINELSNDDLQINQWLHLVASEQDKIAFSKLFKHFAPKIRAYGLQRFKQEAAAMELVQETMMLVWRKGALYEHSKGKASTWIFTVMRNYCFDMLRKIQHKKEESISEYLWPNNDTDDGSSEPDHLLSRSLLAHIDSLPEPQKKVIEAIYLHDMTQHELAQEMNLPLGTVKSRVRLAVAKLKIKMEGES